MVLVSTHVPYGRMFRILTSKLGFVSLAHHLLHEVSATLLPMQPRYLYYAADLLNSISGQIHNALSRSPCMHLFIVLEVANAWRMPPFLKALRRSNTSKPYLSYR